MASSSLDQTFAAHARVLAPGPTIVDHTAKPALFSVISWGCAGTAWLARALGSHPDIFCLHAANHYWSSMLRQPLADGVDYLNVVVSMGKGFPVIGEVHGVSRELLPAVREWYGNRFQAAVLVREPMRRVLSQINLSRELGSVRHWDPAHLHNIARKAGLDPARQKEAQWVQLHAFEMLNVICEERQIGPVYRIEDLGTDPLAMTSLIRHLSGDTLSVNADWLTHLRAIPPINQHSNHHGLQALDDESRHYLRRIVTDEARDHYRSLGYEVDW